MTDYIQPIVQALIQYIPLFAVIIGLVFAVKFISPILLLRVKRNTKQTNTSYKPKTLIESAEDFFGNAPQIYMQLENMVSEMRAKGATEEQLKPLLEKQKWVGRIADPMYGNVIQSIALGGIKYVKKMGLNI